MSKRNEKLDRAVVYGHRLLAEIAILGAKQAIKYFSPSFVMKATLVGEHRRRGSSVLITYGKPNYTERKFIKAALKDGEPFPIETVQVKFPKKGS